MEKIKLSRKEKQVLRLLYSGCGCPETYPFDVFASCVDTLERKGLARGAWTEEHRLGDAKITVRGKTYMYFNPSLKNPVDWKWVVTTGIAFVGLLMSIIALLIACKSLK